MKKILIGVMLACAACVAFAEMDEFEQTYSLITTNSDTGAQVVRGLAEAVWVDVAATKTNVILISCPEGTIFTKTVSTDALFPLRIPATTTAGANIVDGSTTNNIFVQWPLDSKVTIRAAGAADTTGTNAVTVKLIFSK